MGLSNQEGYFQVPGKVKGRYFSIENISPYHLN
jgi:hypothetical protein